MERTIRRVFVALFLSALAGSTLVACGSDLAAGDSGGPRDQDDPDPLPDEAQLVHTTSECAKTGPGATGTCSFSWSTGSEVTLRTQLISGQKQPVGDRAVHYKVANGSGSLSQKRPVTDKDGIAAAKFKTPESSGETTILASVDEFQGVDSKEIADLPLTVKWVLRFRPKGGGRLRVHVSYKGIYNESDEIPDVKKTAVSLFPSSKKSCDDLFGTYGGRRDPDFDSSTLPTAVTTKEKELNADGTATFEFNKSVDVGTSYTAWIQTYRVQQQGSQSKVELARGCKSGSPELKLGKDVNFPSYEDESKFDIVDDGIPIRDHAPVLDESYSVTHHFDLTEALPDNVERWVNLLGLLVKSPGAFLVGCKPGDSKSLPDGTTVELCPDEGIPGLLKLIADSDVAKDILPSDVVDAVNDILNQDIAREATRDVIDSVVLEQVDDIPVAGDARKITDDIISSLQNFGAKGPIRFENRPQPRYVDGTPVVKYEKEDTLQSWTQFAFYWRYGNDCDQAQDFQACRTQWIDVQKFMSGSDAVIEGSFNGELRSIDKLHVRPHELTINFGDLMIGLLEHVVFPRYFSAASGPSDAVIKDVDDDQNGVVTFDEMLGGLLVRCDELADGVGDGDGNVDGTLESAINKVCIDLRSNLVGQLKEWIKRELKLENTNVRLHTPGAQNQGSSGGSSSDATPCALHQPGKYPQSWDYQPLPYIEKLGTEKNQCSWNVTFSAPNQSGTFDDVGGTFYGPRKN